MELEMKKVNKTYFLFNSTTLQNDAKNLTRNHDTQILIMIMIKIKKGGKKQKKNKKGGKNRGRK